MIDGLVIFPPTSVGFGSKLEMKVHRLLLSFSINIMPVLHIVIMCDGSGLHGLSGLLVDAVFSFLHTLPALLWDSITLPFTVLSFHRGG